MPDHPPVPAANALPDAPECENSALFVVGAPRSGTTLTRTLLKGFPGVYLLPDEFQILPAFLATAEAGAGEDALADLVEVSAFAGHMRRRGLWPGRDAVRDAMSGRSPARAFEALVRSVAARDVAGAVEIWGDKTPETVFDLDLVSRHWPDARILFVTRDPRATVLSMHKAWGRSIVRGAAIWRDAQEAALRFTAAHGPERHFTVRFEALTESPTEELDRIGAWLGRPFDHDSLASAASEERWGRATGETGVQSRSPDWQTALSPRQIRRIEEICFGAMQAVGYAPVSARRVRTPGRAQLAAARAGDALRVLRAYARERGWSAALTYKTTQWRTRRKRL